QRDGSLLLFLNNTRVAVARDGVVEPISDGLPGEENTRFNDVLVDSRGRVICGVLPTEGGSSGSLYSLTSNAPVTKLFDGMQLPNGMAFSPDERELYVADTRAKHILAFDYDVASGAATEPRTLIDFSAGDGGPDGITVDVEGCLWVAAPGSWAVTRYGPDGTLLQRVPLPARKPTSVGFGGDDMDTLFVTSASRESTPGEELGPEAGALFAFRPGVRGVADHRTDWGT
ncbi:MAG: SMP-30/gluconolactonase/LRE family protein, partial [Chloroflexi bacterium]|nr:SMP-30/gluconolactonase/LRE family protein [Chloroflexota bacterium]